MKSTHAYSSLLILALAGTVAADVPKKQPLSRYRTLWDNSPFTSKPPPAEAGPQENPLDDYALIGVSPIENNGHRVTLINKKKPDERIIVDTGKSGTGFTILGVDRKDGNPLGTTVRMKSGSMTGVVTFDEKLLTIAAPKPAAVPQPQNGQPPQPQLQQGQVPQPQRQPRPRVVPPPAQQGGQAQPAQQNQRPNRRGNN